MKRGIMTLAIVATLAFVGFLAAQSAPETFTATATAKAATRSEAMSLIRA